jgi:hypothetical protein
MGKHAETVGIYEKIKNQVLYLPAPPFLRVPNLI